jgi:hypothetical protein
MELKVQFWLPPPACSNGIRASLFLKSDREGRLAFFEQRRFLLWTTVGCHRNSTRRDFLSVGARDTGGGAFDTFSKPTPRGETVSTVTEPRATRFSLKPEKRAPRNGHTIYIYFVSAVRASRGRSVRVNMRIFQASPSRT